MKRKLFLFLCALLTSVGMWADVTPETSTLVAGNTYYLYNSTLHGFLSKSGESAYLTIYGDAWNVEESGSNYKIRLKDDVNGYFGGQWWASIGSGNSSTEFAITSVSGGYTLRNLTYWSSDDKALVYINTDNHGQVACNYAADFTAYTTWQFVSESDYQDYVDALNGAHSGIDITRMTINNPDFSHSTWSTGWTGTGTDKAKAFVSQTNTSFSGKFAEMWVPANSTMSAGDLNQTVTLPAGIYELSAKIVARNINCSLYASIGDLDQSLTCNSSSVTTKTLTFAITAENSSVKIGYKHNGGKNTSGDIWVAIDDFTLKYLGNGGTSIYIPNNSFETGNISPWSTVGGSDTGVRDNGNATYTISNANGSKVFNIWDNGTGTKTVKQTLNYLPAGYYALTALMASDKDNTVSLYAGSVSSTIKASDDGKGKGVDGTVVFQVANDNDPVEIGMTSSKWFKADYFRLKYYGPSTEVSSTVTNAITNSIADKPMNASVRSELATRLATNTLESYNSAREYLYTDVQTSVAAYATAAPVVAKMQTLLDNTNFYTTTTYNNFNAYITNYENELLTNDQATDLNNTIFSSTKNAGLAAKLIMSNFEINGDASNPAYYANTWSTEGNTDGSNMTTPFLEYWVSDANTLSDRVIKATQTGLESSTTYAIRALVRVRKSNGSAEATPSGINMQVGSGTEVDVCGGTNVNTNFWFGTYTATGTSDESGNLDLRFNVDDTNASWLAVKNITYLKLDFSALVTAISNTEAVLGFEDGEYAPYANTAKMTALTNAKNVLNGTTSVSTQDEIDSYTDALNNAAWTAANTGSVNAVYNPMFSLSTNDGAMVGWETDNSAGLGGALHARAFVLTEGMTNYDKLEVFGQDDDTRSCAFLRFDGTNSSISTKYTYGKTSGYTMPLKADVLYRLNLQLGGWGQNSKGIKVAITNEAGTEIASETETTSDKPISGDGGVLTDYSFDFRPTTAGNYYMVISNTSGQNNAIVVSNISLMSVDELAEHTEAVKAGDITSLVQNPDFQSAATGWNGYTNYPSLTRGWRGENVTDKFIERTSTGSMAQIIYNMPAGTYKVVAAARGYNGGKITASINGTTGSTLNCTGDTQSGNAEINTNGVQMPYSSAGGFTKDNNGHNWQWISATAVLNEAGNLTISFNTEGTAWMAIDDVHLYYMSDAYSGHSATATYCMTAPTIDASQLVANSGKVTTCDLVVSNPNAIVRSQSIINTAAGEQMNNNYTNTGGYVMNKMVLYDGYNYTDYSTSEAFRITNGAILYRELLEDTWSSLVVPFYPTNLDEMKVPSSYSDGTLTFEDAPGKDMNNVPMLVKSTAGVNYIEGSRNGTYGTGYGDNITVGDLTMNAVYTAGKIAASTDAMSNFAVGSDNNLHKVTGSNVNIKGFRAYFSIVGGETLARIALDLDGTTAINAIETIETETLKDGKYLIEGKIVIVKNGVKYSANGQILK